MKANKDPGGQMNRDRYAELRRILEERRREIMSEVHTKIRDVRMPSSWRATSTSTARPSTTSTAALSPRSSARDRETRGGLVTAPPAPRAASTTATAPDSVTRNTR